MESQCDESELPDSRNIKMEPIDVDDHAMVELVEIKPEPDIKVEPDEVDTIEYTVTSNQMHGIFAVKVEKVEADDSDDDDLVNLNTTPKSTMKAKPSDKRRSGGMQNQSVGKSNAMNQPSRSKQRHGANKDRNKLSAPNVKTTMANSIGKVRLALKPKAKTRHRKCHKSDRITDSHNFKQHMKSKIENAPPKVQSNSMKKRKEQLKCTACDYVASSPSHLKIHMLKHTGEKPFACKSCSKRFASKRNLQSHIKVHVKQNSLNCSICLQIFAKKTELVGHETACKQLRYECHLCKIYTTLYVTKLKAHMRVHSGVRPFRCGQCSMKFKQKSDLNKHTKTHTNSRPLKFCCTVCARTFFEQSKKMAHELNCKRRRYECYLCQSYMTHQKSVLQSHMRMQHTGERPFKCNLCERSYLMFSKLNYHKKVSHK